MIEEQVISYILETRDWDFIKKNDFDETYFKAYSKEFLFIAKHVDKYGTTPDLTTFLAEFEDFDIFEISESKEFLAEKLKESKCFDLIVKSINEVNELSLTDSFKALEAMRGAVEEITRKISGGVGAEEYDLVSRAFERAEEYRKRMSVQGLLGIPSNFLDLDSYTHGWLEQDFVSVTARTGEGKSWFLSNLGLQAWLSKFRVAHFTLENSKLMTAYRFDTLLGHFSNDGLMSGSEVLEWKDKRPEKTKDDYFKFIDGLRNFDIPYYLIDAQDSNDEQFSPQRIFDVSTELNADLILVDQLSLLKPDKPKRTIREGYVSITRAFRRGTNEIGKPIILASQSSREAAKEAKKNPDSTPELHQMMESDSIPQDSTRVIALKQMDGLLRVDLKKNTYGRAGFKGLAKWDIDLGILKPIDLSPESASTSVF